MPRVSVLMVSHNAGRFLAPAVGDVLRQTYRDLELVLVDNASSDGSVDALLEAVSDPRLRVMRSDKNLGPYGGAALGLPTCSGELIARMDADDRISPRRLSVQTELLDADPALGAVSCFTRRIDEDDRVIGEWSGPSAPADVYKRSRFQMPVNHAALLVRRSLLEAVPYRVQLPLAADYDFVTRAVERASIAAAPIVLYDYRQHVGAVSTSRALVQLAMACVVRLAAYRRGRGDDERLEAEVAWGLDAAARVGSARELLLEHAARLEDAGAHGLATWAYREALRLGASAGVVGSYARAVGRGLHATPRGLARLTKRVLTAPGSLVEEGVLE